MWSSNNCGDLRLRERTFGGLLSMGRRSPCATWRGYWLNWNVIVVITICLSIGLDSIMIGVCYMGGRNRGVNCERCLMKEWPMAGLQLWNFNGALIEVTVVVKLIEMCEKRKHLILLLKLLVFKNGPLDFLELNESLQTKHVVSYAKLYIFKFFNNDVL